MLYINYKADYNRAIVGIMVTIIERRVDHKEGVCVKSLCCGVSMKLNIIAK